MFEVWPGDEPVPPLLTAVLAAGAVGSRAKIMAASSADEALKYVLGPGAPLTENDGVHDDGVQNLLKLARCIFDPSW